MSSFRDAQFAVEMQTLIQEREASRHNASRVAASDAEAALTALKRQDGDNPYRHR
jgi:hypothetical protein